MEGFFHTLIRDPPSLSFSSSSSFTTCSSLQKPAILPVAQLPGYPVAHLFLYRGPPPKLSVSSRILAVPYRTNAIIPPQPLGTTRTTLSLFEILHGIFSSLHNSSEHLALSTQHSIRTTLHSNTNHQRCLPLLDLLPPRASARSNPHL